MLELPIFDLRRYPDTLHLDQQDSYACRCCQQSLCQLLGDFPLSHVLLTGRVGKTGCFSLCSFFLNVVEVFGREMSSQVLVPSDVNQWCSDCGLESDNQIIFG